MRSERVGNLFEGINQVEVLKTVLSRFDSYTNKVHQGWVSQVPTRNNVSKMIPVTSDGLKVGSNQFYSFFSISLSLSQLSPESNYRVLITRPYVIDTSAPGFRLLASMGWDPSSNPSLGNSDSQAAIVANGGTTFSKKISSIPIAKEDNLGIGMKRGSAASVVGSLKAIGVPTGSNGMGLGAAGGGVAKVSGFVTAGSGSSTPNGTGGTGSSQGGEFGGLLARLNKMKEQGSLVATPIPSDTDTESNKKRKRSGSTSSASSSSSSSDESEPSDESSSDSDSESESTPALPIASTSTSTSASPAPSSSSSFAAVILKNPRMA